MIGRTVEDRLREEYFELLPEIRRVANELEAEVKHCLLPISRKLEPHERVLVTSRIKDCESAVGKLRLRQEPAIFDPDRPDLYNLRSLTDLAGVRVSVFPRSRCTEVDEAIRKRKPFKSWELDSGYASDQNNGAKYHGYCSASRKLAGEIQIVPMLTALFWAVEHDAIYKPSPRLKGISNSLEIQNRYNAVLNALAAFEEEFETLIRRNPERA